MRPILALAFLLSFSSLAQDLVTCGWDDVTAWRISGTSATPLWRWTAADSNLPESVKPLFATTSDSKPCPGGNVLITSSGGDSLSGAVALVNPLTSNAVFYARAP